MTLTVEAQQNKPKRITNPYFLYCSKRRAEILKISIKELGSEFKALSEEIKDKLRAEFMNLSETYEDNLAEWRKKYNVSEADERRKVSKVKKSKREESDIETKSEKNKGDKKKSKKLKKAEKAKKAEEKN